MLDTLKAVPAPIQSETTVAFVNLHEITFDDEIFKPRYNLLFDYDAAPPGLNLVPSFQVKGLAISTLEINLELQQDQSFEIQNDLSTFWRVVNGPPATVTSLSVTSKSCTLRIDLTDPNLKVLVLQVLCRKTGQTEFSGKEEIEGGLFLSIVNPEPTLQPTSIPPGTPLTGIICITGTDSHGRLKYNIFDESVYTDLSIVSAELEPEPAVRVKQAEPVDVKIFLEPDSESDVLTFLAIENQPGEIAIQMHEPEDKPSTLNVDFVPNEEGGPHLRQCDIQWFSANNSERRNYFVTSFSMEIHQLTTEAREILKGQGWNGQYDFKLLKLISKLNKDPEFRPTFPRVGDVDPTIIDAPVCTEINGRLVCSA